MFAQSSLARVLLCAAGLSIGSVAAAAEWQVEVTNVTPGQTFTPLLAVAHYPPIRLFELGAPASQELSLLAEAGDTAPFTAALTGQRGIGSIQTVPDLLGPGETRSFVVSGRIGQSLSFAGMLIPTNDTFVAIDSVTLPVAGTRTLRALAYDAGSEANDQNCMHIPGPRCGGEGASPTPTPEDEGFVHVSNGFHDLGGGTEVLTPAHYDWNNPVAIVKIRRVH
jgi:hypothetical protein